MRTIVQQAAARIDLPLPTVHLGPEPSVNEWDMLAVGLPVWIWTDGQAAIDASTNQQGIALQLVATLDDVTVDTGDGNTMTCTSSTPRQAGADPMTPSPDCGHTWLAHGDYTITATNHWTIRWAALGQTGTLAMDRMASRPVRVGQLASVLVR